MSPARQGDSRALTRSPCHSQMPRGVRPAMRTPLISVSKVKGKPVTEISLVAKLPPAATEARAAAVTCSRTMSAPTNQLPVVDTLPDRSMYVTNTLTVPITATDADGDPMTLGVAGLPAWGILTPKAKKKKAYKAYRKFIRQHR